MKIMQNKLSEISFCEHYLYFYFHVSFLSAICLRGNYRRGNGLDGQLLFIYGGGGLAGNTNQIIWNEMFFCFSLDPQNVEK
jgi:hypothetical protein